MTTGRQAVCVALLLMFSFCPLAGRGGAPGPGSDLDAFMQVGVTTNHFSGAKYTHLTLGFAFVVGQAHRTQGPNHVPLRFDRFWAPDRFAITASRATVKITYGMPHDLRKAEMQWQPFLHGFSYRRRKPLPTREFVLLDGETVLWTQRFVWPVRRYESVVWSFTLSEKGRGDALERHFELSFDPASRKCHVTQHHSDGRKHREYSVLAGKLHGRSNCWTYIGGRQHEHVEYWWHGIQTEKTKYEQKLAEERKRVQERTPGLSDK